jgi:thiol:disulfide interchange protein DsbD
MRRIDRMMSLLMTRIKRHGLCLYTLVALLLTGTVNAQTGLSIQLVPETSAIVPGETFRVGLFIHHEPGWHTYWRQPGIVGVPTTIAWALPDGFEAGPLEYPEPEATKMFQIKAQGYERDVLLQTVIRAPKNLKIGSQITLQGKAAWMCCNQSCHPASKELKLTLPVAEKATLDALWHPVFQKERDAYAKPSTAWKATAEEKDLDVTLTIKAVGDDARPFSQEEVDKASILFFTEDGWINTDEPQHLSLAADGSLSIRLTRAEIFLGKTIPTKLQGIVQRQGGWHRDGSLRSLTLQPLLRR